MATPGRLLHLLVEMGLKLSSVEYVVFDEADRLFEMGFSDQLREILFKLPESRWRFQFFSLFKRSVVVGTKWSVSSSQADAAVLGHAAQAAGGVCQGWAPRPGSGETRRGIETQPAAQDDIPRREVRGQIGRSPSPVEGRGLVRRADGRVCSNQAPCGVPKRGICIIIYHLTHTPSLPLPQLILSAGISVCYVYSSLDQTGEMLHYCSLLSVPLSLPPSPSQLAR